MLAMLHTVGERSDRGRRRRRAGRVVALLTAAMTLLPLGLTPAGAIDGAPPAPGDDPTVDLGSMHSVTSFSGAPVMWSRGFTGRGVDVALIDTGVVEVDGLAGPDKLLHGPDLSWESQDPGLAHLDTYGHGTHMAGIIAGRDGLTDRGGYTARASGGAAVTSNPRRFLGMAPDARIVSLKAADAEGNSDVTQVIAAIDWVIEHRNTDGLNIRVLNLSYGTSTTQPYRIDPLARAAERAWDAGIFVVVAAGNEGVAGNSRGSLTMPARSPNTFTVGAYELGGSVLWADDTTADYSSTGGNNRRVDVVAPGSHLASLRAPGSFIDQVAGSTGRVNDTLFRGSGTSQAAAVVSGAAALLIQQRPRITPLQLKTLLRDTALPMRGIGAAWQGRGRLNLFAASSVPTPTRRVHRDTPTVGGGALGGGPYVGSRGTGTMLYSVRPIAGGATLVAGQQFPEGLYGNRDIFGRPLDTRAHGALRPESRAWTGGVWNGTTWTGTKFVGNAWETVTWTSPDWVGAPWGSADSGPSLFSGARWRDAGWTGVELTTDGWTGARWRGARWSGARWRADAWTGARWRGNSWSSGKWE